MQVSMGDRRFFNNNKKGETAELRNELCSNDKPRVKDALKKVIAAMTVGKDVSMLFPDVTRNMQTEDLELKKLIYLYLINYAKTQPEMAILAVNTFVKDAMDINPLLRALAIRTMGCIRVDKITEYLCDPLESALKDKDPYVRKTAAIAVAKLFDMNPELATERGFMSALQELTGDDVPMVVSNAVAALQEIYEISGTRQLEFTRTTLTHFLNALDTCTEWGQVYLLDCVAEYKADAAEDAEQVITRVLSRLQHANPAVVLAAVKVVLAQVGTVADAERAQGLVRKLAPPLVTLLSGEAEVQYVALRNISLILQRYPSVLTHEVKVFFCKYNDPIFVKLEKLDVMVRLASAGNIEQVLAELKEYAQEVDVEFVRKSVRCIGQCAIRLEECAQRCVAYLLELVKLKVSYVVQEAVIVIKDIFRRYPNKYEGIITDLCESLDVLEEPEARAAMMWIVGEYADRIDNADELLAYFLDSFPDEPAQVQLQLLTATVKLFLKRPTEGPQQMISQVLTCATQETDNPDLRDRAFMYWRMLSNLPQDASRVVLAEKPTIEDTQSRLPEPLLDALLGHLSSLASVYHKLPNTFVSRQREELQKASELEERRLEEEMEDGADAAEPSSAVAEPAAGPSDQAPEEEPPAPPPPPPAPVADLLGDLLGVEEEQPPATSAEPRPPGVEHLLDGLHIGGEAVAPPAPPAPPAPTAAAAPPAALPAAPAQAPMAAPPRVAVVANGGALPKLAEAAGCQICGALGLVGGRPVYHMQLYNGGAAPMSDFMIQFNKNVLGVAPLTPVVPLAVLQPGESARVAVELQLNPDKLDASKTSSALQIALKFTPADVTYFQDTIALASVATLESRLDAQAFLKAWGELQSPVIHPALELSLPAPAAVEAALEGTCYVLAVRPVPGSSMHAMYVACRPVLAPDVLFELKYTPLAGVVALTVKSERPALSALVVDALHRLFAS